MFAIKLTLRKNKVGKHILIKNVKIKKSKIKVCKNNRIYSESQR